MEEEMLDIVDENDVVIGQDTKKNKFEKGLISRNVAVYIKDKEGKLVVCKRSHTKTTFPNRYDTSACGHVKLGESYEDAARRELKEELGIECDLVLLKKNFTKMKHNDKPLHFFTGIYLGEWDGDITTNSELQGFEKLHKEEVEKLMEENPDLFVPAFREEVLRMKEKLFQ